MAQNNAGKLPFDPTACQFCFQVGKPLQSCSRCKKMVYCCREHQMLDWRRHRKLCGAIVESTDKLSYNVDGYETLKTFKVVLKFCWEEKLGRKLDFYEESVWLSFEFCGICFGRERVRLCQVCFMEGWCSEEHKALDRRHLVYCKELKLCREINRLAGRTELKIEDWYKGFVDTQTPTDINELVNLGHFPNEQMRRVYSHMLSPLGTLIFALKTTNTSQKHLQIHVVGASAEETKYNWCLTSNFLLKFFPKITYLTFHFIGPELPTANFPPQNFNSTNSNITFHFHPHCYHNTNLNPPDLVVLYNAGLHEYPPEMNLWTPTLAKLVNQACPLVLTGYTKGEVLRDKDILLGESDRLETIFLGKNPFYSLKPFKNWETSEIVYYSNNYVFVCRKKLSGNGET